MLLKSSRNPCRLLLPDVGTDWWRTHVERAAKWSPRASGVFLQGDCLVGSSRSISAAVALGPVLTREVMEMARGTWVSGVWCCVGKQGLASHQGLCQLLVFPFQTREQLWPKLLVQSRNMFYSHVLHFPFDISFKRLSGFLLPPLSLWHHSLLHSTQEGHHAGACVACVFKTW